MSEEERNAYAQQAIEAVLSYDGWDRAGKYLGLELADLDDGSADRGDPIPPPDPKHFATGPETDGHKALKAWVVEHPEVFKAHGTFERGDTEQGLSSGDRLDVLFDNGRTRLAVEVKAKDAHDAEVQRGVYQCIKYRATLRAMQLAATMPPNAQAVLVLERKPSRNVVNLAMRLSVVIMNVEELR
jgi:hypothetical protein